MTRIMALSEQLLQEIGDIIREPWKQESTLSPSTGPFAPGNHLLDLNATVFCAGIADPWSLVTGQKPAYTATAYKTFLRAAAIVVGSEGGWVAGYDGDRFLAIFSGGQKDTAAVRAALKLHYVVKKTINTLLTSHFPTTRYVLRHVVGIDAGKLFMTRSGPTPADYPIWLGAAINRAASMARLSGDFACRVSEVVYENSDDSTKSSGGKPMWEYVTAKEIGCKLYRSSWLWPL